MFALRLACVCGVYFLLGWSGLTLASINNSASPIWPASGFALAVLIIGGYRYAPAVYAGAFVTNLTTGSPILAVSLIALGNMLEAVAGRCIYLRLLGRQDSRLRQALALTAAVVAAPAVSATVGMGSLVALGTVALTYADRGWVTWWVGDATGMLLVAPFMLEVNSCCLNRDRILRGLPFYFIGTLLNLLVCTGRVPAALFLLNLPILFLLIQEDCRSWAWAYNLVVLAITGWYAVKGFSPFHFGRLNERLIEMQTLMALLALSTLFMATRPRRSMTNASSLILCGGWLAMAGLFQYMVFVDRRDEMIHTTDLQLEVREALGKQVAVLDGALRAAKAFYLASDSVERDEWRTYVQTIELKERYPGVLDLAVAENVRPEVLSSFLAWGRKEHGDEFRLRALPGGTIEPAPDGRYYVVKFGHPIKPERRPLGLVISGDSSRRSAAESAAALNESVGTRRLSLYEEDEAQPGFLVYHPLFKNGVPPGGRDERVKEVVRWVFAPVLFKEFVDNALSQLSGRAHLMLKQEDGADLYESQSGVRPSALGYAPSVKSVIDLFHVPVEMTVTGIGSFDGGGPISAAAVLLAIGIIVLLVFVVAGNLEDFRAAAEEQVRQKTNELIQSARMASIGEMASGIAHEINNPLGVVAGKAGLLLQAYQAGKPPAAERMVSELERIVHHCFRIAKIITSLKSLARNSAGEPMVRVKVGSVISDTLDLCAEKFKNHGVRIDVSGPMELEFTGRATQIFQILTNLLNNAFDAVGLLEERWVRIEVKAENRMIKLAVVDSGGGIPPAVRERLMQPFFTTKEVGKGTGLGLSISRQIAEEHGGRLYLDSVHANTCFVLELPLIAAGT